MANAHVRSRPIIESLGILTGAGGADYVAGGATINAHTYVAITFINDSVFESGSTGLVPETAYSWPSSTDGATLLVSGSAEVDGISFKAGTTIYGRWTAFELLSGNCIAYVG